MASAFIPATVINNLQWAENLFTLTLDTELQPFKAGQFVRLQLSVDGEQIAKPYSLVNPPQQASAEVLYNIVPDGVMSHALAALKAGDVIEISQPAYGFFVLDELPETKHLWMFGTGTGFGPYLSILQDKDVWQRFEKIVLVHAVSYANNLVYQELIERLLLEHPDQFIYQPIVSRESHDGALQGRIPALIENDELEAATTLTITPEQSHIMLCGNQHMIADARTVLAERGLKKHLRRKPGHITTEQYF
jgi:ferredoxin--NADP+ reductase